MTNMVAMAKTERTLGDVFAQGLHVKMIAEQLGGHVHVGVWAGTEQQARNQVRPKLGSLVMDPEQWMLFGSLMHSVHVHGVYVDIAEDPTPAATVAVVSVGEQLDRLIAIRDELQQMLDLAGEELTATRAERDKLQHNLKVTRGNLTATQARVVELERYLDDVEDVEWGPRPRHLGDTEPRCPQQRTAGTCPPEAPTAPCELCPAVAAAQAVLRASKAQRAAEPVLMRDTASWQAADAEARRGERDAFAQIRATQAEGCTCGFGKTGTDPWCFLHGNQGGQIR